MMQNTTTTPLTWDLALATRMQASGMNFAQLARVFGLSPDTIHCRLDPDYRFKRAQDKRPKYQSAVYAFRHYGDRVKEDQIAALRASIPDDTRDFTARAFGDPVFARSAAAQVKEQQPTANRITLPRVSILGDRP